MKKRIFVMFLAVLMGSQPVLPVLAESMEEVTEESSSLAPEKVEEENETERERTEEEVLHHAEGLGISHDRGVRINLHEVVDVCGMVRLHVLNDEVIGFRSIQNGSDVVQPLMGEIGIYGVHNGDLFILDHIGVVSHAVGNHILSLK